MLRTALGDVNSPGLLACAECICRVGSLHWKEPLGKEMGCWQWEAALESTAMEMPEGLWADTSQVPPIALGKAVSLLEFYFRQSCEKLEFEESFLKLWTWTTARMRDDFSATWT